MQNNPQSTLAAVLAATLIALASGSAAAIDVGDRIEVHGFGDLGHEVANANATGRGLGDRETGHNLSLVGVWQATDRLNAWAQTPGRSCSKALRPRGLPNCQAKGRCHALE